MYVPICISDYPRPIPVCRPVCQRVKDACFPLMLSYGFQWPELMR